MNVAYLIQYDDLFGPGRLMSSLRDFGIPCELVRLHKREKIPPNLSEARLLVLLGGTARVSDVENHSFIKTSVEAARTFVEQDRAVVGIGLGAELLAIAAGAKVTELRKPTPPPAPGADPAPPGELTPELGWVNVTWPFPGSTEPVVFGMMDNAPFFSWHSDTFGLPALPPPANPPPPPARPPTGNVLMASTRLCRNSAFRFKNRIFGFQFHFELSRDQILKIIDSQKTHTHLSLELVAKLISDTDANYPRYERLGNKLIENIVQFTRTY